jgi:lipopolysaccharide export system permease protein
MNKIDRYISGLFLTYFIGGLLIFVTIFLGVTALTMMRDYPHVDYPIWISYFGYNIPETLYRMVPVATVLGVVFTLSTMNKSNELVALYSIGMGIMRVCAPILFWVFILCGVELLVGDQVLPNFAKQKNFIFFNSIKKNPALYSMVKTDRIWYRSRDTIFNIKTLNEKAHKAQGLMLYYFNDAWDLMQMISAKEVDLKGSQWLLHDGSVTVFTEESSFPISSHFTEKTIVMNEESKDLTASANAGDVLSLKELTYFIKKNKDAGLDTIRYEVDLQSKYSYSVAALVMALLGIPFSISRARSGGTMLNIGICLGLIFVFWLSYNSALQLGNFGQIPPLLAAWGPLMAMGIFALYFIRRARV